jgi:P27 family predicted phage terminase small subunit
MRGRKPKATIIKLIQGNRGKRPIRKNTIDPAPVMADPPAFLCQEVADEWRRVVKALFALLIISELDMAALAGYCQAWATFVRANAAIIEQAKADPIFCGLVIETKSHNLIPNPLVGIRNKAAADVIKYAAEFGMTPASRTRITANVETNSEEPGEKYFS